MEQEIRFEVWMQRADSIVIERTGLSAYDLEDWCWRDAYDCGDTPKEAANDFLADVVPDAALTVLYYNDDEIWHDGQELETWE